MLPEQDSPAARFRGRVNWLADTLPDLGIRRLDAQTIAGELSSLCYGRRSLEELKQADWLTFYQQVVGHDRVTEVQRLAPETLVLPGGNRVKIRYEPGKSPVLSVRIQDVFGLLATPRIAGGRVPVLLELLGPNLRPQQITDDLASFWENTYPVIRKELRRRYPKHAWPENPQKT